MAYEPGVRRRIDESGKLIPKRRHLVKAAISEGAMLSMLDQRRVGMVRGMWQIATELGLARTLPMR